MKRFALKFLAVAGFAAVLAALVVLIPFLPEDSIQMYRQKHALLARARGKKIICLGGSGVLYNVSTKQLAEALPGYQVINMGYNAGIGLRCNVEEIKPAVMPGDVVLLIPEYNNYDGEYNGGPTTLLALNAVPEVVSRLSAAHLRYLVMHHGIKFVPVKLFSCLETRSAARNGAYSSLDEAGDLIIRTPAMKPARIALQLDLHGKEYRESVAIINSFSAFCASRGARVFLLYPAFPLPHYRADERKFAEFHTALSRDVVPKILNTPDLATYDESLFHDTAYHLNATGREKNTKAIADLLKRLPLDPEAAVAGRLPQVRR